MQLSDPGEGAPIIEKRGSLGERVVACLTATPALPTFAMSLNGEAHELARVATVHWLVSDGTREPRPPPIKAETCVWSLPSLDLLWMEGGLMTVSRGAILAKVKSVYWLRPPDDN